MSNHSTRLMRLAAALVSVSVLTALAASAPGDDGQDKPVHIRGNVGPDVICSNIFNFANWGVAGGTAAFSIGTRSCNAGTMPVSWRDGTDDFPDNRHPVIAQNMYRLQDGRFEQIGQSWLKHGFCAVDGDDFCSGCDDTGTCDVLGVGCSDPYSPTLNGFQPSLGPKWQVDPTNGDFPYPPADPSWDGDIARRLQVAVADLPSDPGMPRTSARWFVEAQYLAADDALFANDMNNASYREVELEEANIIGFAGETVAEQPAIFAWQDADPDVTIVAIDVPNDGRFYLGYRVQQVGRAYHYEIAVQNYNSDRAGHGLTVDAPPGVEVTTVGFHDVDYHSGEPFDNTDWSHQRLADGLRWAGEPYADNVNANALRWGTLYNVRFQSDRPPRTAPLRLELFKPHPDGFVTVAAVGPTPNEDVDLDGAVGPGDVDAVLTDWGQTVSPADVNDDQVVNVFDLLAVLAAWGW